MEQSSLYSSMYQTSSQSSSKHGKSNEFTISPLHSAPQFLSSAQSQHHLTAQTKRWIPTRHCRSRSVQLTSPTSSTPEVWKTSAGVASRHQIRPNEVCDNVRSGGLHLSKGSGESQVPVVPLTPAHRRVADSVPVLQDDCEVNETVNCLAVA